MFLLGLDKCVWKNPNFFKEKEWVGNMTLTVNRNALQSVGMAPKVSGQEKDGQTTEVCRLIIKIHFVRYPQPPALQVDEIIEKIYANMSACLWRIRIGSVSLGSGHKRLLIRLVLRLSLFFFSWPHWFGGSWSQALAKNQGNYKAMFRKGSQGLGGFENKKFIGYVSIWAHCDPRQAHFRQGAGRSGNWKTTDYRQWTREGAQTEDERWPDVLLLS